MRTPDGQSSAGRAPCPARALGRWFQWPRHLAGMLAAPSCHLAGYAAEQPSSMPARHLASAPMPEIVGKASIPLIRVVAMMTMHAMSHEVERTLASLTIRNLEPGLKERLRIRAAHQGRSMEAEARAILEAALAGAGRRGERSLSERIHGRFAALGGVELELPPRHAGRPPPEFD